MQSPREGRGGNLSVPELGSGKKAGDRAAILPKVQNFVELISYLNYNDFLFSNVHTNHIIHYSKSRVKEEDKNYKIRRVYTTFCCQNMFRFIATYHYVVLISNIKQF